MPSLPPKKPSLAFFGSIDRRERRGFPGSIGIASSDAAVLYPVAQ
jgi:hypothetical protein